MNNTLNFNIINTYSRIHTNIKYTADNSVSFEGSQKQSEFFEAWNKIQLYYNRRSTPIKKINFLEIGAWKGLWAIAFHEFCKLNNIDGSYLTVTMIDQDPNNQPLYKTLNYINQHGTHADLINLNTLDDSCVSRINKYFSSFNIVFIDAGHKYDEVINDINKFVNFASDILLFHDIRPKATNYGCGVYQAIIDSNIQLDEEIIDNENTMGIGIKYVNSYT